ncbi:MAG: hypothetical protein JNL36_00685 [Candidatus Kapabacteria bacterium]|nr:hypothetical protein [Candidatus Kapabacteria bacterium]
MKSFLFSLILLFSIASFQPTSTFAQTNKASADKKLSPSIMLDNIAFAYTSLNTVEITGAEADAFMEVRGVLAKILTDAQTAKKQPTDIVLVELTVPQAQNLILLLQRAKFKGEDAVRYQEIVKAIKDIADKEKK